MTVNDAAQALGKNKTGIVSALQERSLSYSTAHKQIYFGHETARKLFNFSFSPKVFVFQIVKGGTGKTSLVHEFAIRASLYGAKVLCIDMDQQGNLTHAFNVNADPLPVMIDILVDNHPLKESIVSAAPGIDLLPSRFENAMLDEVLRLKKLPIESVYREPFQALKKDYDVVIVDCPPSLGQSVAACALAADYVLAPVTPDKFALSGLEMAHQYIDELQGGFGLKIHLGVVLNKYESRTALSQNALKQLLKDPRYEGKLLKNYIRYSQEFSKVIDNQGSIFESLKPSIAKEDVDGLTQELLDLTLHLNSKYSTFDTVKKLTSSIIRTSHSLEVDISKS